jgi:hypothetical protein
VLALRSRSLVQLTHLRHERLHQHASAIEIVHADVPLRPVRLIIEAAHNILRHLLSPACQAIRHTDVVPNVVEHTLDAVRAVEAVAGHASFPFAGFPENVRVRVLFLSADGQWKKAGPRSADQGVTSSSDLVPSVGMRRSCTTEGTSLKCGVLCSELASDLASIRSGGM